MLNKWCGIGRLVRDVEMKTTTNGTEVANFTLAINRDYTPQGQEQQADFIPIIVFGKRAEFCSKYFAKGQLVAVCGRIQTRSWEDNDGKKRYATEVIADECHFADSKKGGENGQAQSNYPLPNNASAPEGFSAAIADKDLPF